MEITKTQLIILSLLIVLVIWYFAIARYSLRAILSGVRISPKQVFFMRLMKIPVKLITEQTIRAHKSGILINFIDLQACTLGGGDIKNIVSGLIYAKSKEIDLDIKEAIQLDQQKLDIENYLKNK